MSVRTLWPWPSLLLAAAATLNPVALGIIHDAFYAGEQLSRSISWALIVVYSPVLAAIVVIEFGIRCYLKYRQKTERSQ